jgi:hypothetical protein
MTNATNATVGETAKLFNIALTGDKYEFTGVSKEVVIDENEIGQSRTDRFALLRTFRLLMKRQ